MSGGMYIPEAQTRRLAEVLAAHPPLQGPPWPSQRYDPTPERVDASAERAEAVAMDPPPLPPATMQTRAPVYKKAPADIRAVVTLYKMLYSSLRAVNRVAYYLTAKYPLARSLVIALAGGPCTEDTAKKRVAQCLKCEHRKPGGRVGYCRTCGCGENKLSDIAFKSKLAKARCPADKWPLSRAWRRRHAK